MITADGDCSHEIKGRLLLERKKTLVYQTNSFVDIIEQYAFSYRINLSENIVYQKKKSYVNYICFAPRTNSWSNGSVG